MRALALVCVFFSFSVLAYDLQGTVRMPREKGLAAVQLVAFGQAVNEPVMSQSLITNSLGIVLKQIPSPKRDVEVYLGVYEVTQAQWTAVLKTNNSMFWVGADLPIENITYMEAKAFLGTLPKNVGETYRLPTKAEWLSACDGESNPRFSEEDQPRKIVSVHKTSRNSKGFFGMLENVSEWCSDRIETRYGYMIVIMGNSYLDAEYTKPRLSNPIGYAYDYRSSFLGMRVVMERAKSRGLTTGDQRKALNK